MITHYLNNLLSCFPVFDLKYKKTFHTESKHNFYRFSEATSDIAACTDARLSMLLFIMDMIIMSGMSKT